MNRAQGDATRFNALYEEFRQAPEVTRKRLFIETMERVLPKVGRKIVVDEDVDGLTPIMSFEGVSAARTSRQVAAQQAGEGSP